MIGPGLSSALRSTTHLAWDRRLGTVMALGGQRNTWTVFRWNSQDRAPPCPRPRSLLRPVPAPVPAPPRTRTPLRPVPALSPLRPIPVPALPCPHSRSLSRPSPAPVPCPALATPPPHSGPAPKLMALREPPPAAAQEPFAPSALGGVG